MSRFSNALAEAISSISMTQTEFGAQVGLPLAQINKYVRGSVDVGGSNLERIAKFLPPEQRAEVIRAWILDHIPESAAGMITLLTPASAKETPTQSKSAMSPELRDACDFLEAEAIDHPEISDVLIDLARALRSR